MTESISASPPQAAPLIFVSPIQWFHEERSWDESYIERKFSFSPPDIADYVLCRTWAEELTRNPHRNNAVGVHIISANEKHVVWQAWVDDSDDFFGANHWLNVKLHAHWILRSATSEERAQYGCTDLPEPAPPWIPPENAPTSPQPPRQRWEFSRVVRAHCLDTHTGRETSYYDFIGFSNSSCADAEQKALQEIHSRDVCRYPKAGGAPDNTRTFSRAEPIPNPRCP